jgi:SAM-dependent methyltransferase
MNEAELLADLNACLPPGVDWRQGAIDYLRSVHQARDHSDGAAKPYRRLDASSPAAAYREVAELLENFVNTFTTVKLPAGAVILDVACGTGWLAHYWERLGYKSYGFDICLDFVEIARRRVADDPLSTRDVNEMFFVHDIEESELRGIDAVDAAIFESCFHHFHNPIAALRNVSRSLSQQGIAVIIEGASHIRPQDYDVMVKYRTIERPYTRDQLIAIIEAAGLPYYAFFAPINQWVAEGFATEHEMPYRIAEAFASQNRCICAASFEAIKRIVPDWSPPQSVAFGSGFSPASARDTWWCGPHGELRVMRDCDIVRLEVGPSIHPQTVAVYGAVGSCVRLILTEPKIIEIKAVRRGERIHLCSDHAFSPSWNGADDIRLLSFWVKLL